MVSSYVELQAATNFSFLRGASHPDELVVTAAALGHPAIAVTDRNSLAGVVRAHGTAKELGIRLIVGARLVLEDGPEMLCLPTDRAAYGRLCRLLTLGNRRARKGECHLRLADLLGQTEGQVLLALPPDRPDDTFAVHLAALREACGDRAYLAAQHLLRGDDEERLHHLAVLGRRLGVAMVATNDVLYHAPARRPLQDVLTCIREHCTIEEAGWRLHANVERYLKPAEAMARLFRHHPEAIARTNEVAARCRFSLDELRYEYPVDPVPAGSTPQAEMERLTWEGAAGRYPEGIPERVRAQIAHEFALIGQLDYAPYFLTVHDIVAFARSRGILCQGRGSAANSAVCFCLGITSVDPARSDVLFERFISAARNEPPDIDVDFEHERREEVIQYIYGKYGRERAGIAATVITYRSRSAIRDVGKAMGLSEDVVGALAGTLWGSSRDPVQRRHIQEIGLDPDEPRLALALEMAEEIRGFPRHLSQHVGGFVMTRGALDEVVPVGNAAMPERTFIEWDKDDLDALGILKVDVLALGMLTCIRKCFALIARHHGRELSLATVPAEDPAVYDMLCQGDSVGVFQVESRAQMAMLPRLRPRCFYDLVIEVAIVRPGPIQGDMVHPYLRRRMGQEAVSFPSPEMERVLGKTLGVPLFQEQAMRIAIEAAGFSPEEADRLRRAMATFRRSGMIHQFREKFIGGMLARGYERDFAGRCFKQIEGFGEYGFPESHAASFALLVYVSAWLKCHYPAAFACALLNSQPMGFYAPAQIVRDARDHGVELRPVDVNASGWDCTLEGGRVSTRPADQSYAVTPAKAGVHLPEIDVGAHGRRRLSGRPKASGKWMPASAGMTRSYGIPALRLGFRQVKGLAEREMRALVAAREPAYADPHDVRRRGQASPAALELLARADAFAAMGLERREALWAVKRLGEPPLPLFDPASAPEEAVRLPEMRPGEQVFEDYSAIRLTLRRHPLELLREGLARDGVAPAARLRTAEGRLRVAGLVTVRQRPATASGVIFLTMEDETGIANVIVWPKVFEAHRKAVLRASLLCVGGRVQKDGPAGDVVHLIAEKMTDMSALFDRLKAPGGGGLMAGSRDFR